MPTLGPTATPADSGGADVGRIALGRIGPMPAGGGSLTSISAYLNAPNASWGETIGLLYADNSGAPGALLAQTAPFFSLPDSTPGWRTAPTTTSPALSAGSYYWVGVQVEHDSMSIYSDNVTADYAQINSGTFGTLPDPFGTPDTIRTDLQLAAYIDYATGSGNALAGDAAASATATGDLKFPSVVVTELHGPNTTALVADATPFVAVYDTIGGTMIDAGAGSIVGGTLKFKKAGLGGAGTDRFVVARWTVGADEYTYAATVTLVDA